MVQSLGRIQSTLPLYINRNQFDLLVYLPTELALHILSFLDYKSLYKSSQVSKQWCNLTKDPQLKWNKTLIIFNRLLGSVHHCYQFPTVDLFPELRLLSRDCLLFKTRSSLYIGKRENSEWHFQPYDIKKARISLNEDHFLFQGDGKSSLVSRGDNRKEYFGTPEDVILDGGFLHDHLYTTIDQKGQIVLWDLEKKSHERPFPKHQFLNLELDHTSFNNGRWLICQNPPEENRRRYIWTLVDVTKRCVTSLSAAPTVNHYQVYGDILWKMEPKSVSSSQISDGSIQPIWSSYLEPDTERRVCSMIYDDRWIIIGEEVPNVYNDVRITIRDIAKGTIHWRIPDEILESLVQGDELSEIHKSIQHGYLFLSGNGLLVVIHIDSKTIFPTIQAKHLMKSERAFEIHDVIFVKGAQSYDNHVLLLLTDVEAAKKQVDYFLVESRLPNLLEEPSLGGADVVT